MSRNNEITVKGIILDARPQGEYGRRTLLLTDRLGKITAFAGSAAKSSSGIIGAVRPLTSAEFTIARGRSAWNIHTVKLIDSFQELPLNPDTYAYAFYVLELAGYFSAEGMDEHESRDLLNLMYVTLRALRGDYADASGASGFITCIYELRILVMQGEYTDTPVLSVQSEYYPLLDRITAFWAYVIRSPLSSLYRFSLSADPVLRGGFNQAVEILFKNQVPHDFHSLQILHITGL